jgi:hypothetical protein
VVELADTPITLIVDERVATWRLCVREHGVFVVPIELGCDQGSSSVASDPRTAIEQWQAQTMRPPAIVDAAPEAAERPASVPPPKPVRPPAWGASLGAAAGVLLRFPGLSASVHVDVAALHRSGVFVGALGSLAPSRAEQLAVIDALGLATVGWRGRVSDRVALAPSLGLGVAVHRFHYEDEPVGHLVDLAVRIPLELQVRLAPRIYASFAVAGTASTRRIEHLVGDTAIWTRGVFRLEALLGLRFTR